MNEGDISKCPFHNGQLSQAAGAGPRNRDWWPNQLNLTILRQHSELSNPMEKDFNYAEAFKSLDLAEVKKKTLQIYFKPLRTGGLLITVIMVLS